ncbi:MAG: condensation domain-containing protein, partial [Actinobacteria bacterium]|nr:condensation domain-containing protein [Actinomycetota bacterium]
AVSLTGPLDVAALEAALNEVVRRHEALRTRFATVDGRPRQRVVPAPVLRLEAADLAAAGGEAEAQRVAAEEAGRPFDLAQGPLVRARLLRLSPRHHVVVLVLHHIVADGWSLNLLFEELAVLYAAFAQGRPSPLAEPAIQYADFAAWQRQWLSGEVLQTQLRYWHQRLEDLPALELPTDRPRPPLARGEGASERFTLPPALAQGVAALARQAGATPFMALLAGWAALLHRYGGQSEVVVGTPIAGRTRVEIEPLIGFFANTLVLRTDVGGNPTTRELLGRVREVCLGAYAHQDLPFERLVEELAPEREPSRNPLFQVMFSLEPRRKWPELPGLRLRPLPVPTATAKFDLTLALAEAPEGLRGVAEYSTDLFDPPTVARLVGHYRRLLEAMVADPDRPVAYLDFLD